jgi:hypothetical protein
MSKYKSINDITPAEWDAVRPPTTTPDSPKTVKVLKFPTKLRNEDQNAKYKSKRTRTI